MKKIILSLVFCAITGAQTFARTSSVITITNKENIVKLLLDLPTTMRKIQAYELVSSKKLQVSLIKASCESQFGHGTYRNPITTVRMFIQFAEKYPIYGLHSEETIYTTCPSFLR